MITPLSPDWLATKAWLETEIEACRADLENPTCGDIEAHQIRGRIAAYRHFLATVLKPPVEAHSTVLADKSGY